MVELLAAVPEAAFQQPRGVLRAVTQTGSSTIKASFGNELAATIGTVARPDLDYFFADAIWYLSTTKPPIYIEDDPTGFGECAICGKRGALGRCSKCGLLLHLTCAVPSVPGNDLPCPRCTREEEEVPEEWWKMGVHGPRYGEKTVVSRPVGLDRGLDHRSPCKLNELPSEEEAKAAGFDTAAEYHA
jgi:hypothetical protein